MLTNIQYIFGKFEIKEIFSRGVTIQKAGAHESISEYLEDHKLKYTKSLVNATFGSGKKSC